MSVDCYRLKKYIFLLIISMCNMQHCSPHIKVTYHMRLSSTLDKVDEVEDLNVNYQHSVGHKQAFNGQCTTFNSSLIIHFDLCYTPGVKVYETNEKELIMEPAVRWAGNPNIVLGLKVLSLEITVQVRRA